MCNLILFLAATVSSPFPSLLPLSPSSSLWLFLFLAGWDWRAELRNSSRIPLGLVPDPHPCPWPMSCVPHQCLPDGINLEIMKWCGLEGPEGHLFKHFFYRNEGSEAQSGDVRGWVQGHMHIRAGLRAQVSGPLSGLPLCHLLFPAIWTEWVWMGK